AARDDVAGRRQQVEVEHVIAEGPDPEVVLAMDVHGESATDGREHGAGHHRRPPAVLEAVLPQHLDGHARFGGDHTRVGVPGQDPVHAGEVDDDVLVVEGGVAVAVPAAAEADGAPRGGGTREHG